MRFASSYLDQPVDLNELATSLVAIEDWLRDSCTARHNDDMADRVHEAWAVVEDLVDGGKSS